MPRHIHYESLDMVCIAAAIFLSVSCWVFLSKRFLARRLLPPSPAGHWLWGHREILSSPYLGVVLGTGYGDILSLVTPSENLVVLNTIGLATELLDKQSAITSDRPTNVMANELMGWGNTVSFSQHNRRHKQLRRLIGPALNTTAVRAYASQQQENVAVLLQAICTNPADFLRYIDQTTTRQIMRIAYGYNVVDNDPFLKVTQEAIHYLGVGTISHFWVNRFPILKHLPPWFPGAGFRDVGERGKRSRERYTQIPFQAVVDDMSNGRLIMPSFTSRILTEKGTLDTSHYDVDLVKTAAAAFFLAGTTTTSSFLATFVLVMALYPELAAHAQREIDTVVPQDRLPFIEDRELLPYVDAFIQEVMRFHPPVPLGLPHRTTEDVKYGNYQIPAGTTIRSNIWGMLHDSRVYAEPHTFDPKRFLKINPDPDPRKYVFGFGRRACPGIHLANDGLWLTSAGLLWAFDVSASPELMNRVNEIGGKNSPELYKLFQPFGVR
ncbi:hypothetical protein FRC08_002464 [Ceratobasidium sp. 394]|nr:hypothetical protein FRC08_002464 [Ceratobasidium sp. 394]